VLLRLLVGDDPDQTRVAEEWIEGGATIPHLVLAETTWVLRTVYRRLPDQIVSLIGMLLQHPDLRIQHAEAVYAALDHYRAKPVLKFSDCLILANCARSAQQLGTFDKKLGKMPGAKWLLQKK